LGRLALSGAGIAERDRMVFDWCTARGLPCVITMGVGTLYRLKTRLRFIFKQSR